MELTATTPVHKQKEYQGVKNFTLVTRHLALSANNFTVHQIFGHPTTPKFSVQSAFPWDELISHDTVFYILRGKNS